MREISPGESRHITSVIMPFTLASPLVSTMPSTLASTINAIMAATMALTHGFELWSSQTNDFNIDTDDVASYLGAWHYLGLGNDWLSQCQIM